MHTNPYSLIRPVVLAFHFPSVAVGIYQGGEESYYCIGNTGLVGRPVTQRTVYPVGSASKAFIAAAVMQLHESGRIDLDRPVIEVMPEFEMYTPELTRQLTIRDMLCHRSGLPRHDATLFTCMDLSLEEMVHRIRYMQPFCSIGEHFHYQNHMFAALSLLVQRVTGLPWGRYVQQEIFAPLGMTRSYTRSFAYRHSDTDYARPMAVLGPLKLPIKSVPTDSTGCAGSISASCEDMMHWVRANLSAARQEAAGTVVTRSASEQLHDRQMSILSGEMMPFELPEVTESHYGLGWFVEQFRDHKLVHHGGTLPGFNTLVGFIPDCDFAYVILSNGAGTPACMALGYTLCDSALEQPDGDWASRLKEIQKKMMVEARQKYRKALERPDVSPSTEGCAGFYNNGAYGTLEVTNRRGKLLVSGRGLPGGMALVPSKQDEYALKLPTMGGTFPCHFVRTDRQVTALEAKLEERLDAYIPFEKL